MNALTANRSSSAVVLCYHSVAPAGPPFFTVSPDLLERHLGVLRRRGWATGGLDGLRDLAAGRPPDRPTAFLTFDDGYVDNHEHALPILRDHGATATVFILPRHVEHGADLDWPELQPHRRRWPGLFRSMTWTMVEDLVDAGLSIGSHTLTHPHLDRLDGPALADELAGSRSLVEDRLGRCDAIAYPFGAWNQAVASAAAVAGYDIGLTLPSGGQWTAGPLSVPRIVIDHRDGERRFERKLSTVGRALWLSPARGAAKRVVAASAKIRGRRP